jgi:D-arabinose 5-phosphate isomerase GutQ
VDDQVRMPIRSGDLVILFSRSGDRKEVVLVSKKKAKKAWTEIVVVTNSKDSIIYSMVTITLHLPKLDEEFVYGGKDFNVQPSISKRFWRL